MKENKKIFPHIGMRIIKSAVAIALCYVIYYLRENEGILIYAQLAALWCIQTYTADMKKNAVQRIYGTVYGAVFGLFALLLKHYIENRWGYPFFLHVILVSVMIVVVLYTSVWIGQKDIAYFSCVVLLSIIGNYIQEGNPYVFTWNRFLDTAIGILIGVAVNSFSLPKNRQQDTLFISGLDDILFDEHEKLSNYSKVELNRMLDKGMNFTISTVRTPAMVEKLMQDVRLKLPIIAMDGAVLYDMGKREYQKVYVISKDMSARIIKQIHDMGIYCFANVIIEDMLVIYYDERMNPVQKSLLTDLKLSPHRNYVNRPLPADVEVVYFMVYDEKEKIEGLYGGLYDGGFDRHLKLVKYDSVDKPDYSYLKIFNKNANKANMIEYLKQNTGLDKTVTFGSIPDKYDIVVEMGNVNKVIQTLRNLYEPVVKIKLKNE